MASGVDGRTSLAIEPDNMSVNLYTAVLCCNTGLYSELEKQNNICALGGPNVHGRLK
jgi:hypothetical protein